MTARGGQAAGGAVTHPPIYARTGTMMMTSRDSEWARAADVCNDAVETIALSCKKSAQYNSTN
jgi:hypothetical protein